MFNKLLDDPVHNYYENKYHNYYSKFMMAYMIEMLQHLSSDKVNQTLMDYISKGINLMVVVNIQNSIPANWLCAKLYAISKEDYNIMLHENRDAYIKCRTLEILSKTLNSEMILPGRLLYSENINMNTEVETSLISCSLYLDCSRKSKLFSFIK